MAMKLARFTGTLCALGLAVAAGPAGAAGWPDRPVRIVVSSGAGGTADIVARLLAQKLEAAFGQPFVVENKPGAGGHVGAAQVARSPADGYVWLMSGSPTHSVGPHLYKNLPYDPMRDVPPAAMVAIAPNLLVVNRELPVRSVAELVALAREKPGELTYSSAGNGTSGHLAGALLQSMAGIRLKHVPYKTGPDAVTSVIAGDVSMTFFTVPAVMKQVQAGRLRALAVTSSARTPLAPDLPTVAEAGYPGFDVLGWYALFAPKDTPAQIVDRLSAQVERILAQADVRERLQQLGAEPHYLDAKDLTAYIAVESPKWKTLIEASGARVD
ncbi:hypothetical protein CDO46_01685 [Pigmentiphaga sp. NML030171]|nr:hypothetical protein CDO46_01685 [Pigmentiphaga sp. NML030171]